MSYDEIAIHFILKPDSMRCMIQRATRESLHPLDNFGRISRLTRVLDDLPPSEENEALHQILVKVARLIHALQTGQAQDDSWIDITGYAVCGLRIQQEHRVSGAENEV